MNEKRPLIITFVGDISFLSAVLSILLITFPGFTAKFGFQTEPVPFFSEGVMMAILPVILLIASVGFLRLKSWGYWLLIIYNLFFVVANIIYFLLNKKLITSGFMITFIELLFIIPTKRYFGRSQGQDYQEIHN